MKNTTLLLTLFALALSACTSTRGLERRAGRELEKRITTSPVFAKSFSGFVLLDPESGQVLADVHGDHYFTPASNTKILTLATCLQVLGDSVPALQTRRQVLNEVENRGVLLLRGTGDPTFLHPYFQAWQSAFEWLKNCRDTVQIYPRETRVERFGSGWAWDDFQDAYSAERSVFPVYGNIVRLTWDGDQYAVEPPFFQKNLHPTPFAEKVKRHEHENLWVLPTVPGPRDTARWLPFTRTSFDLGPGALLADTLGRPVGDLTGWQYETCGQLLSTSRALVEYLRDWGCKRVPDDWHTHYSTPLDTVLRRMMHQSDNFIAEQMLLVCAGQKFGVLQQDTIIRWMLDSVLTGMPQRPRWVDGSGLSRYNLASPQGLAFVLRKLWLEQPHERLLSLFPAGGVSGTIADRYAGADGRPYIFAKTGGMSGIHCLSGYIVTKRGKTLTFSFMHNNFVGSNLPWKEEMGRVLEFVRDAF